MSNNIPFKNTTTPNIETSSFYNEVQKTDVSTIVTPNIAQPLNQTFYKPTTPLSPSGQNLDLIHQQNSSFFLGKYISASPYINNGQTPIMSGQNAIPAARSETPMMLFGEAKSPQTNIVTLYNAKNNNNNNIANKNNNLNTHNEVLTSTRNSDIEPKLQNIVSTANLGCELKLRTIALQAQNAEYNPKRFAAVIMRIREPKTTALIFSSGKMVCTGAKSEDDSKKASRKYAKIIKSLGFNVEFKDFKVQNIVGSCDIKFQIHLNKLNMHLGRLNSSRGYKKDKKYVCHYEPEIFPGLIYHMNEPEIVLLIFVSGKIVLTGAKQKSQIFEAFDKIFPLLKKFRNENKDNKSNKSLHQQEVQEKKESQTKDETKEGE